MDNTVPASNQVRGLTCTLCCSADGDLRYEKTGTSLALTAISNHFTFHTGLSSCGPFQKTEIQNYSENVECVD